MLLPGTAGGLSACGAQYSDIVAAQSVSAYADTSAFDVARVNDALAKLDADMTAFAHRLAERGLAVDRVEYFVEARYSGQHHEIEIPVPVSRFEKAGDVARLVDTFHGVHERLYKVRDEGSSVETVTWKARLTAPLSKPLATRQAVVSAPAPVPDRVTTAFFHKVGRVATPIHLGRQLRAGARIEGPAIIEEPTTTVVVYPGMAATLTAGRNYLLETRPD